MPLERDKITLVIERVLERLKREGALSPPREFPHHDGSMGVFKDMDQAISAVEEAQKRFVTLPLKTRKEIIAHIRKRCFENVEEFSRMAVEETGLGRFEDKIKKNILVIEKTPGVEILEPVTYTGDDGMTLIERAPYNVIGSITPCTNPTETIICNGIGMLAGGNGVVFNPHPSAKEVSRRCVAVINRAIVEKGGPENLLTTLSDPTIESAQRLMKHPGIRLLVVTGGPAVVKVAMNSGKKVIAAGPGNPPVVVDETANLERAGRDTVLGASLDNNIVCVVEKEVLCVNEICPDFKDAMKRAGAFEVDRNQVRDLERLLLEGGSPDKAWIGKDAVKILKEIGVNLSHDVRLIIMEVDISHPFVQEEMLMPVLPVVRVKDVMEGIRLAKEVEHGFGHTACMHSRNIESLSFMAKYINTSIFVKNAPSYAGLGLGGEGYTSFTIASPTGEGLTNAIHFTRERRCTLKEYFRIV